MGGICCSRSRAASARAEEAEGGDSAVIAVHSAAEWTDMWQTHSQSNKLMVIDFSASWCGPCRFIEPAFKAMASHFNNAIFIKIDVDELRDVSEQWKVEAMPTFVLVKHGNEVDRVMGADRDQLERTINMHYAS